MDRGSRLAAIEPVELLRRAPLGAPIGSCVPEVMDVTH
jgi:hypothetical protein